MLHMCRIPFVALLTFIPSSAVEGLSNIAENHTTWQSSTDHGGESSRAVDGGLSSLYGDESCTHTGGGHAIWGLDLGGIADIYYVEVLNRDGATVEFLSDFLVTVSNTGFPVSYDQLSGSFKRCGQYTGYPPSGEWGSITCSPGPVRGRYVYVSIDDPTRWLTMCEVRVFGALVWNALGYIKFKTNECGYEYRAGMVSPASWFYNVSNLDEPHHLGCYAHCNRLPKCTGFKLPAALPGKCEILLEP